MKRSYFRENIDRMAAYVPGEQPPAGARVIKLNTNENPYPPSPKVLEAVRAASGEPLRLYPDPEAKGLREAASKVYEVPPDWILAGNGSDEILALLARACVPEGGTTAYPVPTYSLYPVLARGAGAEAREIPWGDGLSVPEELYENKADLVFLARPNSPTSTCVPLEEVRRLAGGLRCLLVCDEAYADFAEDDCVPLVKEHENLVVLRSLSKSYSLAGARIGLALARPEVIQNLRKVKDSYNLSRPALAAGEAALSDTGWMRKNAESIKTTRARLVGELATLGFEVPTPSANFVFARRREPPARKVFEALKARGILVRYFDVEGLRDGLRITVGTEEETEALVSALREIVS